MDSEFVNLGSITKLQADCNESIGGICQINSQFQANDVQTLSTEDTDIDCCSKTENINLFQHQDLGSKFEVAELTASDEVLLEEMSKVCRCCLGTQGEMRQLFDTHNCFSDVIMMISSVQLQPDDGFPNQICSDCITKTARSIAFKQQIETADETLRQFVSHGYLNGAKLHQIEFDDVEFVISKEDNYLVKNTITDDGNSDEDDSGGGGVGDVEENYDANVCQIENQDVLEEHFKSDDRDVNGNEESNSMEEQRDEADSEDDENLEESQNDTIISEITSKSRRVIHRNHSELNEKDDAKSCTVCGQTFLNKAELLKHGRSVHGAQKTKRNANMRKLVAKSQKEYMEAQQEQSGSGGDDAGLESLIEQNKRSAKTQKYYCKTCKEGFNVESDFNIHNSLHTNDGRFVCLKCSKECTAAIQLKRHVRIHYEDKPYKCHICHKGFPEMGSLTRHFRRHTGEQREKKHLCVFCNKRYYDSHSLNIHLRKHTGERPWVCKICEKSFIDSRLLNSHMKVHSGERPYTCQICQKSFTHQSTLTTHIRTHTGVKPYNCNICDKKFIQSSNLALHMRVHSGEKPYKCKVCSRSFASSSTLTMHNRIHTGEKPYACPTCGKKFARHDLSAHMRTHTGEKPYECTECKRRFTTTGQLNQHSRVHTGARPYTCSICTKQCSTSSYLKKHMRSHQKTIEESIDFDELSQTSLESIAEEQNDLNCGTVFVTKYVTVENDNQNQIVVQQHDDDDGNGVIHQQLDNRTILIHQNDLMNVVNQAGGIDLNNVTIQVPVVSDGIIDGTTEMGTTTVYNSMDDKYFYHTIVPSIMQIQPGESVQQIE